MGIHTLIACLIGLAAITHSQPYRQHGYLHERRPITYSQSSPTLVERGVTITVMKPYETVYQLGDKYYDQAEFEDGVKNHGWVAATTLPPSPVVAATTALSAATAVPNAPVETQSTASTAPASPTNQPSTTAAGESATQTLANTPSALPKTQGDSENEKIFPDGTIPCSQFPSDYGAVYIDWLGLEGWTGVQHVPNFVFGVSASIDGIVTATSGSGGCKPNSFCSYACSPGYQKSQWPEAQGKTGQSIGGLWCNSDSMLQLARPSARQLCTAGVGNIFIENRINKNVAVCRTDYPGSESETIPLDTRPSERYPLTCPDSAQYYKHFGAATSAQYYVNPAGTPVETACQWGDRGDNTGNWAPLNLGVGRSTTGMTYLAILPNNPTNPDGTLDFTITIEGSGVSGDCAYREGKYWNNGVESPTGCTAAVSADAVFVLS